MEIKNKSLVHLTKIIAIAIVVIILGLAVMIVPNKKQIIGINLIVLGILNIFVDFIKYKGSYQRLSTLL